MKYKWSYNALLFPYKFKNDNNDDNNIIANIFISALHISRNRRHVHLLINLIHKCIIFLYIKHEVFTANFIGLVKIWIVDKSVIKFESFSMYFLE